jgi:chromosome partitioning protein
MIELIKLKVAHIPRVNALATLFDNRTKYSQLMLDEIRTFFKDQMLHTLIRINIALKRAVSEGVSIIDFDNQSNCAKDCTALSHEILRFPCGADVHKTIATFAPAQFQGKKKSSLPPEEEIEKAFEAKMQELTFTIEAPDRKGKDIYIVGDFNDRKISEESGLDRGENGCWERRIGGPQGRYRYKFMGDWNWMVDPKNPKFEQNVFGTFDSIMKL